VVALVVPEEELLLEAAEDLEPLVPLDKELRIELPMLLTLLILDMMPPRCKKPALRNPYRLEDRKSLSGVGS
jgi:hypothetical protein